MGPGPRSESPPASREGEGGGLGEDLRVSEPESRESLAGEDPREEESGLSSSSLVRDRDRPLCRGETGHEGKGTDGSPVATMQNWG